MHNYLCKCLSISPLTFRDEWMRCRVDERLVPLLNAVDGHVVTRGIHDRILVQVKQVVSHILTTGNR